MKMRGILSGVALPALAFAMAVPAMAQSVSSSIRGTIVDTEGFSVPNASVTVKNEANGATSTTTSSAGGYFTATGLQVGGPYTVTVSAEGYQTSTTKDIYLTLGEPFRLELTMTAGAAASAEAEEEVVVVGQRASEQEIDKRGVGDNFNADDIAATTSLNRDFRDVVAQSPIAYVDSSGLGEPLSIAGSNPRCNSFLIDGLPNNDTFGLNFNGYPTARSPLPFDWSKQVQVAVSPYDAEYNDFCGGVINVVTRSGENDFHGSAYYYYKDDSMVGDSSKNRTFTLTNFEEKNYGATFSGPIIEDTLFFFVGYDKVERVTPVSIGPGEGNPAGTFATQVPGITQAEIDQVVQIADTVYGYDALQNQNSFAENNERWTAKLNWNINDQHRAQLGYSHAEGGTLSTRSSTSSTLPIIGLPSNWYLDREVIDNYSLQVFSNWTDNFSTELRLGRVNLDAVQQSLGDPFPEVYVRTNGVDNVAGNGDDGYIVIGPDQFRHYNLVQTTFDIIKLTGTYDLDQHVIKGGYERKMLDILNGFVEGSNGIYRFNSIADFQNGIVASTLDTRLGAGRGREPIRYGNAGSNDPVDASAVWGYNVNSLYLQDDWDVTDALSVMVGMRYDWYEAEGTVRSNAGFETAYGFSNDKDLEGLNIFLPRASFSYDVPTDDEDLLVTLRGGVGRYSGGSPNVWVSNSYSGDGISYLQVQGIPGQAITGGNLPAADFIAANGFNVVPVPQALQDLLAAQGANGPVSLLSPDFQIPSIWRFNVGIDALYDGWAFTAEYMGMESLDQLAWRDLRTCLPGSTNCSLAVGPTSAAPDAALGRVRYGTRTDRPTDGGRDLMLYNVDAGHANFVILAAEKEWEFDEGNGTIGLDLGYAWSDVQDIGGGTASTASSNFQQRAVVNINDVTEGRSEYEREHRYTMTADLSYEFFEGSPTKIRLFGSRTSGQPFSYVFSNNPYGGNGQNFRNLLYVPQVDATGNATATSDPLVQYAAGFNFTAFNSYLQNSGLREYAGQIAPRNEFFSPWTSRIDLSVSQEINVYEEHSVTLELNIFNFTNLLNKNWGQVATPNFFPTTGVVSGAIVNNGTVTNGVTCTQPTCYVYSGTISTPDQQINVRSPSSLWQIQIGIRYEF